MTNPAVKTTPLIAQYLRVKDQVPDAILFFRLGDFYEMFFEDAETASRVLDIQLTARSKDGAPLCGVPYHSAEPYIAKLLKSGFKVAICEQGAPDNQLKGLVPRQIVRIITPGTVSEETVLSADRRNYLVVVLEAGDGYALAALEVSTGEFVATLVQNRSTLEEELSRLAPGEILVARDSSELATCVARIGAPVSCLDADYFSERTRQILPRLFGADIATLEEPLQSAAAAALAYVEGTFGRDLNHIRCPQRYQANEYMMVDEVSRRHLELVSSSDATRQGSLLGVLDDTATAMGARMLSRWIVYPLLDPALIGARLDAVEEFFQGDLGGEIFEAMRRIGDLERLVGRLGAMRAGPRDLAHLAVALRAVALVKAGLSSFRSTAITALAARLDPHPALIELIERAIGDDPPALARDGNVIRASYDGRVDEFRELGSNARAVIARLEARERERVKIPSLKVRYNQIFGYYIEITKAHLDRAPAEYERKQTLVSAERFTTPELKELERKILSAESGLKELELQLFTDLLRKLLAHAASLQQVAGAVGELDALISLAKVARKRGYVRPQIDSGVGIEIRNGRHPVLETGLTGGEFVPNDLMIDPQQHQLLLITGPNMAGKSTYLRQVALITVMAQMGSFVPATAARIGVVDRLFTRIGARDELRRGESTFMVEMRETARLLKGLTARSLLLLDEVGRGTSTYDGLAIAWALAEFLHDHSRAKVLFATHFHELTDLAVKHPRIRNLSVAVREWNGEVVFMRTVVEGAASRSYGIEVARLAGLPDLLIKRAREILTNLEQGEFDESGSPRVGRSRQGDKTSQLTLFASAHQPVLDELRALDVNQLTPIEALNTLSRLALQVRSGK